VLVIVQGELDLAAYTQLNLQAQTHTYLSAVDSHKHQRTAKTPHKKLHASDTASPAQSYLKSWVNSATQPQRTCPKLMAGLSKLMRGSSTWPTSKKGTQMPWLGMLNVQNDSHSTSLVGVNSNTTP
jgi:hypothetical protein